jgi:hypothetical protein
MNRTRLPVTASSLLLSFLAFGCGGTTILGGAEDSGAPDAKRFSDASPPSEAGADAPALKDAGKDALDAGSTGTLLAAGKDFVLWGVTSDGFAVYSIAKQDPSIYAVSIAGGSPTEIDTLATAYSYAVVQGNVVAVLNDVTSTGAGTIKLWTSAGGLHTVSSTAYTYEFFLSPDFGSVAYLDNFDSTAATADLYVAKVDGTGAALLQAGIAGISNTSTCYPEFQFAGSAVVLGYCPTLAATSGNIESFAASSSTPIPIVTAGYPYFIADPTGANLLIFAAGLQVVPVGGGTPTTIDANGQSAAFTSDGSTVLYVSSSGALMRSAIASPSPTTLVSSGLEGIYELSPDDSTALVFKSYDSMTYLSDLYAASAAKSGGLTTLSKAQTAVVATPNETGLVNGSAFTKDSSHVLFYTGISTASYPYLGALQASAVASGSPAQLAGNTNTAFPSGSSKVVFEDNFALLAGMSVGTIDIKAIDTQASEGAKVVVTAANGSSYGSSFYLSADGSQIVYAQNATKTRQGGVFVAPVP